MPKLGSAVLAFALLAPALVASEPGGPGAAWHYDTVLKPSERPAWLEKIVLLSEEAWAEPGRKKLKPSFQKLKDAGLVVMVMYPDGFCRLHEPKPGETWPQECRAETEAMHARGMKVLAGVYPFVGSRGPRDLLEAHPEWRLRSDDKVPEAPGNGCIISPFGKALIDLLIARVKEFDIDGYQFDGWYQCTYCRCPGCLRSYSAETGLEVPPRADTADLRYLRYLVWRDKKLLDRMVELQAALKAVKPGAILVNWNNNDVAGNVPSWMPEGLNCVADWTNKEWWDSADVSAIWLIKRLRGASGDRPAGVQPYMFVRHGYDIQSAVYHGSSTPLEEVLYRMHKVMAMGSIPIIWPGARQAWVPADSDRVAADLAEFLPLVHETETLKYAACLDSYTSLQMARAEAERSGITSHRGGMARALLEAHIPFDVISEHNACIEELLKYRVVILPNNKCMSERIADLLRGYVARGGGILATHETSLCDAWGEPRKDFALGDLFGARYQGAAGPGPSRIAFSAEMHPVTEDPRLKGLTGTQGRTTYWGKYSRIERSGASAGTTTAPLAGLDVAREPEGKTVSWTPLLLTERGGGRTSYFPAAMDAAYYEAGYPYQRILLVNALLWAAKGAPPIRVEAPLCVFAGYLTQRGPKGRRAIVHLLNDVNSTMGHGSKEEKQFAIREEVVPVGGVKVVFQGPRPARVRLVPGLRDLEPREAGAAGEVPGWEVTVPEIHLHAAVMAEYGE